jgi:hypothetical protein
MKAQMMIAVYFENVSNANSNVRQYVMKRVYPTVFQITFNAAY